jgi:hypothetical protein
MVGHQRIPEFGVGLRDNSQSGVNENFSDFPNGTRDTCVIKMAFCKSSKQVVWTSGDRECGVVVALEIRTCL